MNEAVVGSFEMIYSFTVDLFEIFVRIQDKHKGGFRNFDTLWINMSFNVAENGYIGN